MLGGPSHREVSELIGSIYDCTLDPSRWEPTLAGIAAAFNCAIASLTLNDVQGNRFLINKAAGWDPHLLQRKSEHHVSEINARLMEWLAQQTSLDEPFVTSLHLTSEYIQASEYVEECLKPQGIVDIMHLFLMYTPRQFAELGLGRHQRQGIITEREIELSKLVLPHLRRAVIISNLLDVKTIEHARMTETLDALNCGVVLTNERGIILHANQVAGHMLSKGGPIKEARGVLQARSPKANRDLTTAIALAARDEIGLGRSSLAIALATPDCSPAFAHVLPMRSGELRTRLRPEAVAAVFIRTMPDHQCAADLIAKVYGLTRTEAQVLRQALNAHTLAEVAKILGVARSTVKSHMDAIYRKTNTSRQSELVRLAMGLLPPLGPSPSIPSS